MRRIVVVGCPGSGKTTLAEKLAGRLGSTHIELDSLFHVTDFGSASPEEFRQALVEAMDAASEGWVICGNYVTMSNELHIARADTLVWLDLPRWTVTGRVAGRTVARAVRRERLYGNDIREPMTNFVRWDPEKNIVRWAWTRHPVYRRDYLERLTGPTWQHLDRHHLTTRRAVTEFLGGVDGAQG